MPTAPVGQSLQIEIPPRQFLPQDFTVTTWSELEPWLKQLQERPINSKADLVGWLRDYNEVQAVVEEDAGWRFIRWTCNTADKATNERYEDFIKNISPKLAKFEQALKLKYANSPYRKELDAQQFEVIDRQLMADIELFREENIPLNSEIKMLAQQYGNIIGDLSVEIEGKEFTLQQANKYLDNPERSLRESVWRKVMAARYAKKDELNRIFDQLLEKRGQVARNAGYDSYVDYRFRELGRFDYGREESYAFHTAIEQKVRPVYEELLSLRREKLGYDKLRPWDLSVDPLGRAPLRPFSDGKELISKTVTALSKLRPDLGQVIALMENMQHLDLESRKGKAPGGYNYPLNETGVPFIFMNAAGLHDDLTTMVHEAGHAVHSFVTRDLPYNFYKDFPSEVAELASMSMELLSMDHWDAFYTDPESLRRARQAQIARGINILPWIATVDAFQFWLYDNPGHDAKQREYKFEELFRRFHGDTLSYEGMEELLRNHWQKQLHIFELPFYYIEYGIAQLGAFQVWRNYRQDAEKGLQDYLEGLKMGFTRPLNELYARAGVRFDFSAPLIEELITMALDEYRRLENDAV